MSHDKAKFTADVRTILEEYGASDGAYYYTPELLAVCQRVHVDVMGSQEPDRNMRLTAVDLAWLLWRRETWKPSERPFDLAVLAVLDAVIVEALEKWCDGMLPPWQHYLWVATSEPPAPVRMNTLHRAGLYAVSGDSIGGDGWYSIVHVPSGQSVLGVLGFEDSQRACIAADQMHALVGDLGQNYVMGEPFAGEDLRRITEARDVAVKRANILSWPEGPRRDAAIRRWGDV